MTREDNAAYTAGCFPAIAETETERQARRDATYAAQLAANSWPSDTCKFCKRAKACCARCSHHVGDMCLHCGNDERARPFTFRGK